MVVTLYKGQPRGEDGAEKGGAHLADAAAHAHSRAVAPDDERIIEAVGQLRGSSPQGGDRRFDIGVGKLDMADVALGDSIAVNGVCLTVIEFGSDWFRADVSNETLACTTLGMLQQGSPVNLEKALTPTTRLGGHLVSGHVDGVGEIVAMRDDGRSVRLDIRAPQSLLRYIAAKGSICVQGISLTVNGIEGDVFGLNIVPHTMQETNLSTATVGTPVNLEVDIIARYLERLLLGGAASDENQGVSETMLAAAGFLDGRNKS